MNHYPKKIAIASGKGGTGKTTVAVNLHHVIKKYLDAGALLVDCDVEEPNDALFFPASVPGRVIPITQPVPKIDLQKCNFCRACTDYCEFNAITIIPPLRHAEISADLCHSCGACLHACNVGAITEYPFEIGKFTKFHEENLVEGNLHVGLAQQTPVIRQVKKLTAPHRGIVIYDAPPGTSCPLVTTVSDVDFVILVAEPTPFGLHDFRLTATLMQEMEKPFGVVINKDHQDYSDLDRYIMNEGIEILGRIPFSREVAAQYSANCLLCESSGGYEQYMIYIVNSLFKIQVT
ncbi:MAG: 4Fe-4S binding protein [Bacteroidota bacterium]